MVQLPLTLDVNMSQSESLLEAVTVVAWYVEGWHLEGDIFEETEDKAKGREVVYYDISTRRTDGLQWRVSHRYSSLHTFHYQVQKRSPFGWVSLLHLYRR
jgi:hypothetical protein